MWPLAGSVSAFGLISNFARFGLKVVGQLWDCDRAWERIGIDQDSEQV
jgi:hypothetical protein